MVFPANFCKFLSETLFFSKIDSLREAKLIRLLSEMINACFSESRKHPKNQTEVHGVKTLFFETNKVAEGDKD